MNIAYSDHAKRRLRQRGILEFEIEDILKYPIYVKNKPEGSKEAVGKSNNKMIKVVYVEEEENYIKVITVI